MANSFFSEHKSLFLGLGSFVLVVAFFTFFVWNQVLEEPGIESECIDINGATAYLFDACYDLRTKTIYMTSRRNAYDDYDLQHLSVSYFDTQDRVVEVDDVPSKGLEKVYQLSASKNPRNLYIDISVGNTFDQPECQLPRRLFVKDCGIAGPPGTQVGTSEASLPQQVDLRTHLLELEVKEELWKRQCESSWECDEWDQCFGGIQKRSCEDLVNCFIPTDVPNTVRYCADTCVEEWSCSWSACIDGVTTPTCTDANACGTEYNKPLAVACDFDEVCEPDVQCSDWSACVVDYSVADLEPGVALTSNLPGMSTRVCADLNGCFGAIQESQECSTSVDVYTQKYVKCNKEYVDVYNKLDGDLIARIDAGEQGSRQVHIRLDGGDAEIYCDYCYNGVLDGDELEIDCGGSCGSCTDERTGPITIGSTTLPGRFINWIKGFF